MKNWQIALIGVVAAVAGVGSWYFSSSGEKEPAAGERATLRSRKTVAVKAKSGKSASRIAERGRQRDAAKTEKSADPKWDPFSKDTSFKVEDVDFTLEGELIQEMSASVLGVLAQIREAQGAFDRKATLASVRKLLEMIRNGESVSAYAKLQALEALKFYGGGLSAVLPEIVQLAADADPKVSETSIAALQELLWDWDTTPRQICDAIKALLPLTSDANIISPFIFEMNDMPAPIKVEATLAIMDSGNKGAKDALGDNMSFVYNDFNNEIKTRQDVVDYGRSHADE